MANSGAIRAGAAYVEIFADSSKLMRGLKAAESSLRKWGNSISSLGKKMMGFGTAIITPLVGAATKAAHFGHEIEKMAQITGAGVESLQGLAYAADQSGLGMGTITKAFTFMHKNMFAVYKGAKQMSQSFAMLGLTAKDLKDKSPEDQFMLIADKIASIKDPTMKAALALKVFGKAGASLLPILNQGAGALRAYYAELKRLGAVMSKEDVEAASSFYRELKKMWYVIKNGLTNAIGSALIPVLKTMVKNMTEAVGMANRWVKENRGVVRMVFWFGAALLATGGALFVFGKAMIFVGGVFGVITTALSAVRAAFLFLISPIGLIITAITAATAAFLYFSGYGGQLLQWLGGCFKSLKDDATKAIGGISAALAKGDLGLAARIGWLFVKMEWLKAKQWMLEIWYGVKMKIMTAWYGVVYGIVDAWNTAVFGIQVGWIETVSFLKKVWIGFKAFWGSTVDWVAKKMLGVWVWWQKLMDPNFDSAGAQKSIDEQFASDANARDAQTNSDLAAAEQERQSRRQGAKSGYDALMDASNQSVTEELQNLSDQSAENLKAVGDELKQAKDAFNTSVTEASKPDKNQPEQKKIPSRKFDWQDSGADKASSVGTFSAFGLSQMGVGSVMQKIADFTQRTAEATEELVDKMDGGELEFGS